MCVNNEPTSLTPRKFMPSYPSDVISAPGALRTLWVHLWSTVCAVNYWQLLDAAGDMLTVGFAAFDIIMDVWIAYTYHCDGRTGFFQIALVLLGIAQVSYAFLFVVMFGANNSNKRNALWFFMVLPFAQLVPLFVYLESLHLEQVDRWLEPWNLEGSRAPSRRTGEDLLVFKLRCKVMSHVGFLVEACVEAVPQSVLQLVAMQHAGEASAFSVLSIVLSISCLASKGYVASFSVHFKTFLFNGICIAADVLNMFASAAWLSSPSQLTPLAAAACSWWTYLASSTAVCLGLMGLGFAIREQTDSNWLQWQKLVTGFRMIRSSDYNDVRTVLWDTFVGTGFVLVCIFPALVVMLSVKLTLIPVLALRSLAMSSERNKARPLFDWLMERDHQLRLYCTTSLLLSGFALESFTDATDDDDRLVSRLLARSSTELKELMHEGSCSQKTLRQMAATENRANLALLGQHMRELVYKALLKLWRDMRGYQGAQVGIPHGWQRRIVTCAEVLAFSSMAAAFVSFALFVLVSAALPVVCVCSHVTQGGHSLEWILSVLYMTLLAGMGSLAPSVMQFECFSDLLAPLTSAVHRHYLNDDRDRARLARHGLPDIEPLYQSVEYRKWTRKKLKQRLTELGLNADGGREKLVNRLTRADEEEYGCGVMDLKALKESYNGWIVGCQVQAGLRARFGLGIPDIIHDAGRRHRARKLRPDMQGDTNGICWESSKRT